MKVNKDIYPDVTTVNDIVISKQLSQYDLNSGLDASVFYSASSSTDYANLNNSLLLGCRYDNANRNNPVYIPFHNIGKNDFQQTIIYRSTLAGGENLGDKNKTIYRNKNSSAIASYYHIVNGFKYYSLIAVPLIAVAGNSNSIGIYTVDDYFTSHSDTPAVGVVIKLFGGTNTSRTDDSYCFGRTQNYNIATTVFDGDNYKIFETESFIDYLGYYNSTAISGGSYRLYNCNTHLGTLFYPYESYENITYGGDDALRAVGKHCGYIYGSNISAYSTENTTDCWTLTFKNQFPTLSFTKNDILHMCATYGLIFTTNISKARSLNLTLDENITDDELYFPVMSDSGLWQGDFVHGEENKNTRQYKDNWNADVNAPFTNGSPELPKKPTFYGDDGLTNNAGNTSALTHRYYLSNSDMKLISTYLNNTDENLIDAIVKNISMAGESPINSVVSIMYIPFDISTYAPAVSDIVIGSNLINIGTSEQPVALSANVITADNIVIDLGECFIEGKNKNFLDYEPYTKYICYIPFCNFVELDADLITDKTLSFQLVCDLVGGTCEGIIRINGHMYKSVSGIFATQCSVQGRDSATYINSLTSTMGKYVSGVGAMVGATLGVATGNLSNLVAGAGLLAGAGTAASAIYDFNTTPKNFTATGKSVGLIGQMLPQHVCVYKYSCSDNADENYGNFVGFACEFSETLNNLHGFTVCSNAFVSCNATNQEKEKIKELLESGVYI